MLKLSSKPRKKELKRRHGDPKPKTAQIEAFQFKPGLSGNPSCKNVGRLRNEVIEAMLAKVPEILTDYWELLKNKAKLNAGDAIRMRGFENWIDRCMGRAPVFMQAAIHTPSAMQGQHAADGTIIDISIEAMTPLLAATYRSIEDERMRRERAAATAAPVETAADEPIEMLSPDDHPSSVADGGTTATPEFEATIVTEGPPKEKPQEPKAKHLDYHGAPADFREHMAQKHGECLSVQATSERDKLMEAKVLEARARGVCQLPRSEVMPPDEADRQPHEIVRFTRIPGGKGVRRC